jgi:hypothetical protein
MAKEKAPDTVTVAFRVTTELKNKVERKYKGFEGKKLLSSRLKELYATLLQR